MKEDVIVRATKDQIREFKNSILFKDIKRELGMWRRGFEKEVLTVVGECIEGRKDMASMLTHLGSVYGRSMAIDYVIKIPDVFLQVLEEKDNDDRRDQTT